MKDPTGQIASILVVPDIEKALATYTSALGSIDCDISTGMTSTSHSTAPAPRST